MLHLNSGLERLLFKSRQTRLKATQMAQRHTGAWHFPMWCSSHPSEYGKPSVPFTRNALAGLNRPQLFMEKASQLKASSQKAAHRNLLVPKWGTLTTVLMNADCRATSHPAKLPVKMSILLSGRHRRKMWHFMPRRSPVPPRSRTACWEWDLWWDWAGSHNSNTAPASRFAEQ